MSCNCGDEGTRNKKTFVQKSIVKAGISIIKHFTNQEYDAFVTPEQKAARLAACENCELLRKKWGANRCGICKCFVEAKSSLKDQTCPHPKGSKWPNI